MVSIKWCLQHKDGISLIEPNSNMSDSYIKMAEESIASLESVQQSKLWTAVMSYYIFYYSLYSLMIKLGVKCEIHSCSLEFMKQYLGHFYNAQDAEMIKNAIRAREDLQYYADRPVDDSKVDEIRTYCKVFFIKTKDILARITEEQVKAIRESLAA